MLYEYNTDFIIAPGSPLPSISPEHLFRTWKFCLAGVPASSSLTIIPLVTELFPGSMADRCSDLRLFLTAQRLFQMIKRLFQTIKRLFQMIKRLFQRKSSKRLMIKRLFQRKSSKRLVILSKPLTNLRLFLAGMTDRSGDLSKRLTNSPEIDKNFPVRWEKGAGTSKLPACPTGEKNSGRGVIVIAFTWNFTTYPTGQCPRSRACRPAA